MEVFRVFSIPFEIPLVENSDSSLEISPTVCDPKASPIGPVRSLHTPPHHVPKREYQHPRAGRFAFCSTRRTRIHSTCRASGGHMYPVRGTRHSEGTPSRTRPTDQSDAPTNSRDPEVWKSRRSTAHGVCSLSLSDTSSSKDSPTSPECTFIHVRHPTTPPTSKESRMRDKSEAHSVGAVRAQTSLSSPTLHQRQHLNVTQNVRTRRHNGPLKCD